MEPDEAQTGSEREVAYYPSLTTHLCFCLVVTTKDIKYILKKTKKLSHNVWQTVSASFFKNQHISKATWLLWEKNNKTHSPALNFPHPIMQQRSIFMRSDEIKSVWTGSPCTFPSHKLGFNLQSQQVLIHMLMPQWATRWQQSNFKHLFDHYLWIRVKRLAENGDPQPCI